MKKNNVAKLFGIASLCLGVAISTLSGTMLLDNNVALAGEAETMKVTEFLSTSLAADKITQDENGLRISSDDPYEATFKTVLKGNTQFVFSFPETYTDALYGDFTFRITDAIDPSKYFDITYYVESEKDFNTAPYVQYQDEIRMASYNINGEWYNYKRTGKSNHPFAPCFLSRAYDETRNNRKGILLLSWVGDVLTISSNTTGLQDLVLSRPNMISIASFDGTYDSSAKDNGFVGAGKTSCGLPKITFPNGYIVTVSSSFNDARTTDKASDVLFTSIINADATYAFAADDKGNPPKTEFVMNKQMKKFADGFQVLTTKEATAGKFFLGWRNTETNKLYPAGTLAQKGTYEALEITYETMVGASVRIDLDGGKSGIRFRTLFNVDEYAKLESFIQSKGTLIAYTDTLTNTGKEFTIDNYQGVSTFAQVKNTKGTYEYTDSESGATYVAYSMAVVDIQDYTKAYSARGYLVVEYADGSTKLIYTDYVQAKNSRSIAEVATLLQQTEEYAKLTDEEKQIVDSYVPTNVEPNEPAGEPNGSENNQE